MVNPRGQLVLNILDEMWNGHGWTDPLEPLLDGWRQEQVAKPVAKGMATIEGNIIHTAFWEKFALYMVAGKPLEELGDLEACSNGKSSSVIGSYPQCSADFKQIRAELRNAVSHLDEKTLMEKAPQDSFSREIRAATRAIHSAYHAGQLSFLRRLIGAQEPKGGRVATQPVVSFKGVKKLLLDLIDFTWNGDYSFAPIQELTKGLTKSDSDKTVKSGLPTISGILNHMKFWEEYATLRLQGRDTEKMAVVEPGEMPLGMPGWPEALSSLIEQHEALLSALQVLSDQDLAKPRPGKRKKFEAEKPAQWLVYGSLLHYSYHVGQIVLIRQLLGHSEHFV